jgi:hypothetical protein
LLPCQIGRACLEKLRLGFVNPALPGSAQSSGGAGGIGCLRGSIAQLGKVVDANGFAGCGTGQRPIGCMLRVGSRLLGASADRVQFGQPRAGGSVRGFGFCKFGHVMVFRWGWVGSAVVAPSPVPLRRCKVGIVHCDDGFLGRSMWAASRLAVGLGSPLQ